MQFDGEFVVDGSPAEVWPYFNDPEILEDCAPGCKELTLESPSEIRASLEVGVGSVKPSFEVNGIVVECDEPNRLELQASGEASRNSFDVSAWQELTDNGDGTTTVTWQADAEVSGVIASLGERALESVTNKLVTDFFQDIEDHVVAGTPAEAQFEAAGESEVEAAADAAAAAREGDLLDDLLALLGSIRGGTSDEEDEAADRTALTLSAGAALGLVVALLWSRLRGDDSDESGPASEAATDSTEPDETETSETTTEETESGTAAETAGAGAAAEAESGGRLRYLVAGLALGVAGKALWDAYSSEAATDSTVEEADRPAAGTGEGPTESTAEREESATSRQNGETATATDAAEEGLIENPLDRLN